MKLSIFTIFFLIYISSYACRCAVYEGIDKVKYVFIGKAISVEKEGDFNIFTFEVTKVFKSNIKVGVIKVITYYNTASCGVKFKIDNNYAIYGFKRKKKMIMVNSCSKTIKISNDQIDSYKPAKTNPD